MKPSELSTFIYKICNVINKPIGKKIPSLKTKIKRAENIYLKLNVSEKLQYHISNNILKFNNKEE